jgi:DNA-binding transcriptional regulator YbjK
MAIDETTRKRNALELYQIDEDSIVPFFKSHIAELRKFIREHAESRLSLLELLKQFIRIYRLPFNMQRYMSVQSTFIRETLQERTQNRQDAVSHWIQEHAGRHRDRMIQLQCLFLDRIKARLIPEIQNMLDTTPDEAEEERTVFRP